MNLNVYGLVVWIRAMTENAGMDLKFYPDPEPGKSNPPPATDGEVIYVEKPKMEWSEKEITKWKACVYHEIGHNVPKCRDIFELAKAKKIASNTFFGRVLNQVDDFRQEYYRYDEYLEKKRVMAEGRDIIFESKKKYLKEALAKQPDLFKKFPEAGMLESFWIADSEHRKSWQNSSYFHGQELRDILPADIAAMGDAMCSSEWEERFLGMDTAEDSYELTKLIIDEVFKKNSKEEEKKAQKEWEAQAKGKSKNKAREKGKKDSSATREDVLKKLGKKGAKPTEDELQEAANMDVHLPELEKVSEEDFVPSGSSGHWSGVGTWQPLDPKSFRVRTPPQILAMETRHVYRKVTWFEQSSLAKSVKRVLMTETQTRHIYGQKKGRLHNKNLFRATLKDAPGYNERVMKMKEKQMNLDVAVTVLVDCSGSMSGEKYSCAANSAISFIDALQTIGVPVEVVGFTDNHCLDLFIFKEFDKKAQLDKVKRMFEIVAGRLHNNDDPDAVYWVYNRLKPRKEKRKILISLSDGSPASSINRADLGDGLKNLTRSIKKEGIVEPYAIGMLYDGVRRWWPDHETITDISKLESALLKLIHCKIIRQ